MLREDGGSAALEALLSIMIMFVAFYVLWGVTVIIYNQSQITTASQLAAQAAVNDFVALDPYLSSENHTEAIKNRITDDSNSCSERLITGTNVYTYAQCYGRAQARFVYEANTDALLPNQFTGQKPSASSSDALFQCSTDPRITDEPTVSPDPRYQPCSQDINKVTAVRASYSAPTAFTSVGFLTFGGGSDNKSIANNATAVATRYQGAP
jgi:hypothetical protein